MAWTTIEAYPEDLDDEVATFESGVTSIDSFSIASHRHNTVVALIEYSP